MTKFNKGDKLLCIDPTGCMNIEAGKVYVATGGYSGTACTVGVLDERGHEGYYLPYRFNLVEAAIPEAAPKVPLANLPFKDFSVFKTDGRIVISVPQEATAEQVKVLVDNVFN